MGKQVTELDTLPSFMDTSLLPVHNGAGLKKGTLSQLANYLGTKFSNPNLLINPDFKINQRGSETYTETNSSKMYTMDRWAIIRATATKNSDGTFTVSTDKDGGYLTQPLEAKLIGDYTITCNISSVTGNVYLGGSDGVLLKPGINIYHVNPIQEVAIYLGPNSSVTLKWVKLEQGLIATPFVAPNPTEELMKCKYFFKQESIKSHLLWAGQKWAYILIPKTEGTRISPTITLSDSSIEYSGASGLSGNKNVTSATAFVTTAEYIVVQLNSDFGFSSYTPVMCTNSTNVIIDAEIY